MHTKAFIRFTLLILKKFKIIFKYFRDMLFGYLYYIIEYIKPLKIQDYYNVPIIINNFNRLTTLKYLIISLEIRGYRNIIIIDNSSTYKELLDYYKICKYKVLMLQKNYGPFALWNSGAYKLFKDDFYIYTDSDVVLIDECPDNFVEYFYLIMKEHKLAQKVGFGLRIDDIPNYYLKKEEVISWERQYWLNEIESGIYKASIDTTMALYKPYVKFGVNANVLHLRTGYPYLIKHLPWYNNSNNLSFEELYYQDHVDFPSHW